MEGTGASASGGETTHWQSIGSAFCPLSIVKDESFVSVVTSPYLERWIWQHNFFIMTVAFGLIRYDP